MPPAPSQNTIWAMVPPYWPWQHSEKPQTSNLTSLNGPPVQQYRLANLPELEHLFSSLDTQAIEHALSENPHKEKVGHKTYH